jgi:hypothetical protein
VHPEAWESGAEPAAASTYNFKNHVKKYLKPIRPHVPSYLIDKIEDMFPDILNAFFAIAPRRKNFINYAYVIGLILRDCGINTDGLPIPVLKTPSKVREACDFWFEIKRKIGFKPIKETEGDNAGVHKRTAGGRRKSQPHSLSHLPSLLLT